MIGSSLLGQNWSGPGWFHGRPSASAYIGDVSGGTNLGPGADLAPRWWDDARPSGSAPAPCRGCARCVGERAGPAHLAGVRTTAGRPAPRREVRPRELVERLVGNATQGRVLGFLGEPRVNVLELNLALAKATAR